MLDLHIIAAGVRAERKGIAVANRFAEFAGNDDRLDTRLIDLAAIHLPMDDEPHHPRMNNYTQQTNPSWGNILGDGRNNPVGSLWPTIGAGLPISLVVSTFNLIGDALRGVLDPQCSR